MSVTGLIHDSVLMWAYGVNKTLENGNSPYDGVKVTENIYNLTFTGVSGTVAIDAVGDRIPNYRVDIVQNGTNVPLFHMFAEDTKIRKVYKAGNDTDFSGLNWYGSTIAPVGELPCSERLDCNKKQGNKETVVFIVAIVVIVLSLPLIIGILKQRYEVSFLLYNLHAHYYTCIVTASSSQNFTYVHIMYHTFLNIALHRCAS